MFHRTDEKSKTCDDENRTSTDEPNDEIEHELLPPCLMNVLTLHSAEPLEENGWYPSSWEPAQQDPASTRRYLLDSHSPLA